MKTRPILFSAPMVRALLAGTKTQTRRTVKPQPDPLPGCWFPGPPRSPRDRAKHYANEGHLRRGLPIDFCPYGQPGDQLWVRETFAVPHGSTLRSDVAYRADIPDLGEERAVRRLAKGDPWKPSIFMPRWASRITLEVSGVRVERLQEISEADAIAEGIPPPAKDYGEVQGTARGGYAHLWGEINGADSWAANPRVWVVSFKRVKP